MITSGSVTSPIPPAHPDTRRVRPVSNTLTKYFSSLLCIGAVTLSNGELANVWFSSLRRASCSHQQRMRRPDNGRELRIHRRRPRQPAGGMTRGDNGCATRVMRVQAASGPGRTLGAEHQVHGPAAQVASDRGDPVLTWSYRVAGTTAAWRRGLPVPGDAKNRRHAPGKNDHVGPTATHAVSGTPDAPVRGNDHRNELGAHIETARLPFAGDSVHRETGHFACLVPVLRGRKAKRHSPGSAGQCLPSSRRMCRAPMR